MMQQIAAEIRVGIGCSVASVKPSHLFAADSQQQPAVTIIGDRFTSLLISTPATAGSAWR
jgi:hypothetical protein